MKPVRIQRKRTKGWKMPQNTVYVGRGSRWGNPHRVGVSLTRNPDGSYRYMDAADAAKAFRETLEYWSHPDRGAQRWAFGTLRGKNLACWCPEGQPCHADVLLEVANS